MSEQDISTLIDRIGALVGAMEKPKHAIPFDRQLWDPPTCSAYLGISTSHFSSRLACRPYFPRPICLPTEQGKNQTRRWKSSEVVRWADSRQEKGTRA